MGNVADVVFRCTCERALGAAATLVGRKVTCPGCGDTVRVPAVSLHDPDAPDQRAPAFVLLEPSDESPARLDRRRRLFLSFLMVLLCVGATTYWWKRLRPRSPIDVAGMSGQQLKELGNELAPAAIAEIRPQVLKLLGRSESTDISSAFEHQVTFNPRTRQLLFHLEGELESLKVPNATGMPIRREIGAIVSFDPNSHSWNVVSMTVDKATLIKDITINSQQIDSQRRARLSEFRRVNSSNDHTLPDFEITSEWWLLRVIAHSQVHVEVLDSADRVVNFLDAAEGQERTQFQQFAGRYHLRVEATGEWDCRVEVPASAPAKRK